MTYPVPSKLKIPTTAKPALGDIEACKRYAHKAVKQSTQPHHTLAYIWVRFLNRSFLGGE